MKRRLICFLLLLLLVFQVSANATEIVDLTYLGGVENFDPMTDHTRQIILEELGVNIIAEMGNEPEKVNLILMSGQNYDAIKFGYNMNHLATYITSGMLHDLTDYVEQYGPNLKKAFSQDVWDMVSVDGRIYAIPETDSNDIENGIVVREDWLKIVNMELPTTVDEFYDMLVAFSKLTPEEVGVDYIIPFAANGQNSTLGFNGLVQAFGAALTPYDYVDVDGELKISFDLAGQKEYVEFVRKLYRENLLDADFPATTHQMMVEKVASGVVGAAAFSCWDSAALRTLRETNPDANLVFIQPLSKNGSTPRIAARGGLKNLLLVPKASEKAAEVVKYCNAFLDDQHYKRLILGDEGVHYEERDDTIYPLFPGFDAMNKGRWFYPTNDGKKYTPLFAVRAHKELEMGMMWEDLNAKGGEFKYIEIARFAPLLPEFTQYSNTLINMARETLMKMIMDDNELAKYDDFVADWFSKGGRELADAMNAWYQTRNE
jgi:putative aldouronate transport system substrate-binding protein